MADAAAENSHHKLAMLAYHRCWSVSQDAKVQHYCIQVRGVTPSEVTVTCFCLSQSFIPMCRDNLGPCLKFSNWKVRLATQLPYSIAHFHIT